MSKNITFRKAEISDIVKNVNVEMAPEMLNTIIDALDVYHENRTDLIYDTLNNCRSSEGEGGRLLYDIFSNTLTRQNTRHLLEPCLKETTIYNEDDRNDIREYIELTEALLFLLFIRESV